MYTWLAVGLLIFVSSMILYRPAGSEPVGVEGFTTTAVHPTRVPECVARSTDAQSLLARVAAASGDAADELRLLVSKVCCMEADIATPSAGRYRTLHMQFRTSHDLEPPSSLVGRCLQNAVNARDIELIVEKFKTRGHVLIKAVCVGADEAAAHTELDNVIVRLEMAMTSFCVGKSPVMDRPAGPRDVGFWDPEESDLPQYQGISAQPR